MQRISNLNPIFIDARGNLLDGGKIYIGVANADPETDPVDTFWDEALTIPAAQPIKTLGGIIVNGTQPASIFIAEDDYSQRVKDANGALINYAPSVYVNTDAFQPKDSDLTAIAALSTTPFGRNLLTLADQAALQSATGFPTPLPATGGTVSGSIIRSGAGAYIYWATTGLLGAQYLTAASDPDPTSNPGDIWMGYA